MPLGRNSPQRGQVAGPKPLPPPIAKQRSRLPTGKPHPWRGLSPGWTEPREGPGPPEAPCGAALRPPEGGSGSGAAGRAGRGHGRGRPRGSGPVSWGRSAPLRPGAPGTLPGGCSAPLRSPPRCPLIGPGAAAEGRAGAPRSLGGSAFSAAGLNSRFQRKILCLLHYIR